MSESPPAPKPDHPASSRLVPQRELPPYSYVTGKFPHPIRDPQGHAYGQSVEPAAPLHPSAWEQCESYRFGIDLFNHGYYWEAHEAWEAVWHAMGRSGLVADFLKGLIKLAAAGVKAREGRVEGVRRHAARAHQLFSRVADSCPDAASYAGLSLDELASVCEQLLASPEKYTKTSNKPVVVVLPTLVSCS